MLRRRKFVKFYFIIFFLSASFFLSGIEKDRWEQWLDEVDPIISNAEKDVFKSLGTEEDRVRFQKLFWRMRDTNPDTAQNEYMIEYYTRLRWANNRLGGIHTDRGRIYMILGEPVDKQTYSGSERVVDCELWIYHGEQRPGLPPVMTLIFYRHRDVGEYRLFFPGIHTTLDIIAPGHYDQYSNSRISAYRDVRMSFPELAQATLSVIPGDGDPNYPAVATASNQTFSQIFSLAEKRIDTGYLSGFQALQGMVDVASSFRDLGGFAALSISENRGFRFLNYSIMPQHIRTREKGSGEYFADLEFLLRLEDEQGKTVFQQERKVNFRLKSAEKYEVENRKAVFSDFFPIINGNFRVHVTFLNKTTEEFFSFDDKLELNDDVPALLLGYKTREISGDIFAPLTAGRLMFYTDPRLTFNKADEILGAVSSVDEPQVSLFAFDDPSQEYPFSDIKNRGDYYYFRMPLQELKAAYYILSVRVKGKEIARKRISVLPYTLNKPKPFEWTDPASAGYIYQFDLAQQYLNNSELDKAAQLFLEIPDDLIQPPMLPVIARAFYLKKDYAKVLELLSDERVVQDYRVLLMLGNSCLETKDLPQAAIHFEALRKYGDNVGINRTLGAIYLSMGEKDRAKVYFDRAVELQKKK